MGSECVRPAGSAPHLPPDTTAAQSVRIWIDLMESAHILLVANLTREVGPELAADAYRRWCAALFERHGERTATLAVKLRTAGDVE